MTMIAHYRLDGNAEDSIGDYDGESTNVTWLDGKIGSASDTVRDGSSYITVPHDPTISSRIFGVGTTLSFSFWVNLRQHTNYGLIIGKNSGGSWSNSTSSVWVFSGGIRFVLGSNVGGNPSGSYSHVTVTPSLNEWHHVVCTSGDGVMNIYVDGVIGDTGAIGSGLDRSENTDPIVISGPRSLGISEGVDGMVDDVRIYDHALSLREIRDLSQAKAAHFKFDQFSEPTENTKSSDHPLHAETHKWWTRSGTTTSREQIDDFTVRVFGTQTKDESNGTYYYPTTIYGSNNGGGYYTFSAKVRIDIGDSGHTAIGLRNFGRSSSIYLNQYPRGSVVEFSYTDFIPEGESVIPDLRAGYNVSVNDEIDVTWFDMQLEKKPYATPFTPSTRQGFITDSSNQGGDSEIALATSPQWIGESPVGSGSYRFADGSFITGGNLSVLNQYKGFAISHWAKVDTLNSDFQYTLHLNEGSSNVGSSAIWAGVSNSNYLTATISGIDAGWTAGQTDITPIIGQWYHLAAVWDGSKVDVYVDGVVAKTYSLTSISNQSSTLRLGSYTNSYRHFNGSVSDVRLFNEALSESEIKEIYQQRASLDDHGNLHTSQLVDTNYLYKTSVFDPSKKGIIVRAKPYPIDSNTPRAQLEDEDGNVLAGRMPRAWTIFAWDTRVGDWDYNLNYFGAASVDSSGVVPIPRFDTWNSDIRSAQQEAFCDTIDALKKYHIAVIVGSHAPEHYDERMRERIIHCGGSEAKLEWNTRSSYICIGYVGSGEGDSIREELNNITFEDRDNCAQTAINFISDGYKIGNFTQVMNISEVGVVERITAYYPLGSNTYDYSDNSYHGINSGAAALGDSHSFNGTSDYIRIDDQIIDNPSVLTVMGWMYPETGGSNYRCALHCGTATSVGSTSYWFGVSGADNLTATIGSNTGVGWDAGETNVTVAYGEWIHIAAVWDGQVVRVYLDGVQVTQYNLSSYSTITSPTRIGASSDGDNYQYSGKISQVKILDAALSSEEVAMEYKSNSMKNNNNTKMSLTSDTVYINGEFNEV